MSTPVSPGPPPSPELPPAIGPEASPFWPQHLVDLYLRPTRFFTENLALGKTPYVLLATWALGMSTALDRIDTRLMQADLRNDDRMQQVFQTLFGNWPTFWLIVGVGGAVSGALYWLIGGWWCKVRLRFSGAPEPDPRLARLLLIYASFVCTGPTVVGLLALTLIYPSYLAAWENEILYSLVVVATVFWSLGTMYKGAVALFPVRRGRALAWFAILPALFLFLLMGGMAMLYEWAGAT